jgi:hypothetical protein
MPKKYRVEVVSGDQPISTAMRRVTRKTAKNYKRRFNRMMRARGGHFRAVITDDCAASIDACRATATTLSLFAVAILDSNDQGWIEELGLPRLGADELAKAFNGRSDRGEWRAVVGRILQVSCQPDQRASCATFIREEFFGGSIEGPETEKTPAT